MEYSINTEKNWQTTVSVTVTEDDVKAQYDNAINKVRKDVRFEGFRKGKVPAQMIKKLYGDKVESEANQLAIEAAWNDVFEENDFYMLNDPQVSNLNPTESGGMTFEIEFEIRPQLQVHGYEGMPVEKVIYEITDEDVDDAIKEAQQKNAMMYTIDDEAKEDYYITADFQEVDHTGLPVVGQKIDNQQIWLNKDDTELTPQLVGVKAGDERRITLTVQTQQSEFIEQPGQPDKVEKFYIAHIKEVKERRLPELDDDFAKDLGDYETLQDLRDQIEKNLRLQAEHDTDGNFENALADALIKEIDFELPDTMLNRYLDDIIKDVKKRNKDNPNPINEEQYRDIYRAVAIRDIKWHLISEELRTQEKFEVTEDDIDKKLARYSELGQDGMKRAEAIRNNNQELERLKEGIIFDKLYAFLADKANVTQIVKPWRELREPPIPEESDESYTETVAENA